jgi:N-acetylmuramoyl-L-alanine amidase
MPKRNSIWQFAGQHRVVSIVAGQIVVLAALALMLLGSSFVTKASSVFAASCTGSDTTYVVHSGDTLAEIAQSHQTTLPVLISYNKLANPNRIFVNQHICIPDKAPVIRKKAGNPPHHLIGIKGSHNYFPYGQCTWWADQRYHQLTGVYVPWTTNSNANQWKARAAQYHWNVSSQPRAGSIMMLSPGVEGAFSDGHVAVVEKLLGNGHVQVSQMNWNGGVGIVSYTTFTAAQGIYFITIN